MKTANHNFAQSDQRFEPGTPIKAWAILKNGERVFIDRQNGDGKVAWFFAGRRRIDPQEIQEWK